MKTLRTLFVIAVATLGFATSSFAQKNSSALSVPAGATIIQAIEVTDQTSGAGLNFGQVVAAGEGGTVVLTPAGSRSVTGDTKLGNETGKSVASFKVTGEGNSMYTISLPSTATLTGVTDNSVTTTIGTFKCSIDDLQGQLSSGQQTFTVGATLTVPKDLKAQVYDGSFEVTVTYN
jgi:hypothetical protein